MQIPKVRDLAAAVHVQLVRRNMRDACYYSVKARYAAWPSARASQALAKCRKGKGQVRKSPAGKALKRWGKEKWVNTKTGRPCGNATDKMMRLTAKYALQFRRPWPYHEMPPDMEN